MWLRPTRLPRGIPCIVAGTVYHPYLNDSASDSILLDYLCESLTSIKGMYPGCGLLLCGDFNRLDIRRITSQFKLKQIVNKPTRGDQILDLVMTNMPQLCDNKSVQTLPPFGLSDHNVVTVCPKTRHRALVEDQSRDAICVLVANPS